MQKIEAVNKNTIHRIFAAIISYIYRIRKNQADAEVHLWIWQLAQF